MAQTTLERRAPVSVLLEKGGADAAVLSDSGIVTDDTADVFLDFNDGTSNLTLGINQSGDDPTVGQPNGSSHTGLPWRKHSWVASGGFDGGGFIRMHWFTGMSLGFSPVWVKCPGGYTPHFKIEFKVRQSDTMVHDASSIKVVRTPINFGSFLGTAEWNNGRVRWIWDGLTRASPPESGTLGCGFSTPTQQGTGCSPAVVGMADGNWHDYEIEFDYRVPTACLFWVRFDGVVVLTKAARDSTTNTIGGGLPALGTRMDISPFCETYSGTDPNTFNTGDFDVDHYKYTVLP